MVNCLTERPSKIGLLCLVVEGLALDFAGDACLKDMAEGSAVVVRVVTGDITSIGSACSDGTLT